MKVIANKVGFDNIKLRQPGEEFEFPVLVRPDGSDNLGSWMDIPDDSKKELKKLRDKVAKKSKGEPKPQEETNTNLDK